MKVTRKAHTVIELDESERSALRIILAKADEEEFGEFVFDFATDLYDELTAPGRDSE